MRRPGKGLVGAVEGLSKGTAIKVDDIKIEGEKERPKEMRTVVIKREPQEDGDSAWKNMPVAGKAEEPASPLSKKTANAVPRTEASLTNTLAVNSAPSSATAAATTETSSASSATLSALISGSGAAATRKRPDKPTSAAVPEAALPKEKEKRASLAIFEFEGSSPPQDTSADAAVAAAGSTATDRAKARAGRRHSSISSLRPPVGEGKDGAGAREGKERTAPPPRSRTLKELRQAELDARSHDLRLGQKQGPAEAGGDAGADAVVPTAAATGRLERAASRRRSMML